MARVERARHPRPSSRRHTAKRVKQPVRKTVESIEEARRWICPVCGSGPMYRTEDFREGGFVKFVEFLCQRGCTRWTDSTEAQVQFIKNNRHNKP